MRSSAIAAYATAGLMLAGGITSLAPRLIDQRPAIAIWDIDVSPAVVPDLRKRLADGCRTRLADRECAGRTAAAFTSIMNPIRAEFDRCIAASWIKSRCTVSARSAITTADASSMIAMIDAATAKQREVEQRDRAIAEAKRQAALEADRRQAAAVMGTDDGRSYLLSAYTLRFNSAHRECYEHPGLVRLMQWHTDANPEDYRVITRVRDACQAIMRKQPFVIRPDGTSSILRYPIPPFEQLDYWLRSRCADKGREAWRCIMQAAEGLRALPVSWRELDHETRAILRSLGIFEPSLSRGLTR